VIREVGVALPYWLDRPDEEAVEIAVAAEQAAIETVWVGEMASFDAFALATAIGLKTERVRLRIGPLAVGVRSPVGIALGVASVATLIGRGVDVALGSSSPAIVSGWHDRSWTALAPRMRETCRRCARSSTASAPTSQASTCARTASSCAVHSPTRRSPSRPTGRR